MMIGIQSTRDLIGTHGGPQCDHQRGGDAMQYEMIGTLFM